MSLEGKNRPDNSENPVLVRQKNITAIQSNMCIDILVATICLPYICVNNLAWMLSANVHEFWFASARNERL